MNIAFLSKEKKINKGSYRIPFIVYRNVIESLGIKVTDKVEANTDAVVCMAGEGYIEEIKRKYPKTVAVCVKPHYEINYPKSKLFSSQRLKNIINYIRPLKLNKAYVQHKIDINNADILVADSRRLLREFRSQGYSSVFMRLLEKKIDNKCEDKVMPKIGEELSFTYHGNSALINLEYDDIINILNEFGLDYKVVLNIITDTKGLCIKIRKNTLVKTNIYDYSPKNMQNILERTDIGLVPDKLSVKNKISKFIQTSLFFSSYQNNLDISANKRSANAGRAYVFAQYSIPFAATSTEEILLDFPTYFNELGAANNSRDMKTIIELLCDSKNYDRYRKIMKEDFEKITIENECMKLIAAIEEIQLRK